MRPRVPFLDVRAGHRELRGELQAAFDRVVESGTYVLGAEVEAFENEFAGVAGTRHAIGVGNGLDALTIALRASGIGRGDEVIVPAHTFIATWLAVLGAGAEIVPVDVDPVHLHIDPDAVKAACTERTAAVIPVHLYGDPVEPTPIEAVAVRHGLLVIGDAAQAHGSSVEGRPAGAFGDAAIFSFYPSKNLAALGDAGAITTDDDGISASARRIRNYGSASKYEFIEQGVNSRLDPLQAAFLRAKLRVLAEWNARRASVAERYLNELSAVRDLVLPEWPRPGVVHAWYAFCVRHPRRDALMAHLEDGGIQTQIHYPVPPHRAPVFADQFAGEEFPVTDAAAATVLSLPIGPHLDDDAVGAVIEVVSAFDS